MSLLLFVLVLYYFCFPVVNDTASARRNNDDSEVLATLERCYHHIHNQPYKSPLLNKFLSQEIFDKLKFRLTKYDHSLLDLILPGIKIFARQKVNTEEINPISIMDYESYYVFEELVVPIAKILNGVDYRFMLDPHPESVFFPWQIVEDGENKYDIDFDSIELDSVGKTILNSAIECSRNLNSHTLPSNMTLSQLEQVENMLTGALISHSKGNETDHESFDKRSIMKSENDIDFDDDGDLSTGNGVYCSLSEVLEPDSEAYRQLKLFGLLDSEIDRSVVRRD